MGKLNEHQGDLAPDILKALRFIFPLAGKTPGLLYTVLVPMLSEGCVQAREDTEKIHVIGGLVIQRRQHVEPVFSWSKGGGRVTCMVGQSKTL